MMSAKRETIEENVYISRQEKGVVEQGKGPDHNCHREGCWDSSIEKPREKRTKLRIEFASTN